MSQGNDDNNSTRKLVDSASKVCHTSVFVGGSFFSLANSVAVFCSVLYVDGR